MSVELLANPRVKTERGSSLENRVSVLENYIALLLGTAEIEDGAITTPKLLDGCVAELKIAADAVTNAKIAVDAIQGDVIAAGAITENKLYTGAVTADKIESNAITSAKITAGAVIAGKIAAGVVTATEIATNAITSAKIYAGAVTSSKITVTTLSAIKANMGTITAGKISAVNSLKKIELDSATPHMKVAYNNSDVIQMAVVGSEPRLEVYYGGYIRTRLNKNGIYIFTTAGGQQGRIYGDSSGNQTIFYGTEFYVNASLSTSGSFGFGGSGANNNISGDGTHITFNGLSNAHLTPAGSLTGSACLGTSTNYWGDVNYKTLTDRGCLGWFDNGVELQNGRIVSDCEALQAIKKHPTEKTIYGVEKLDYKTFPKVSYKPVKIAKKNIYETEKLGKGKRNILRFKKGEKIGEDGVEMTSMFSIMIGAIKELDNRLKSLETKLA